MGLLTRIRRMLSDLSKGRQDPPAAGAQPYANAAAPEVKRTEDADLTPEDKATIRYAMLSVYQNSLGRQFEIRGAPAMALPSQMEPLSLEDALKLLGRWPDRLRDAAWRIVRAYPPRRRADVPLDDRYPRALREALTGNDAALQLEEFDRRRRTYRWAAHLFASALVAVAQERWQDFGALRELVRKPPHGGQDAQEFSEVARLALGKTPVALLDDVTSDANARETAARELGKIEDDVGLNINDFVEQFADALAFDRFWPMVRDNRATVVYPASSVIQQDTRTLVTTATVTTLLHGDFKTLTLACDPQCWALDSDVMKMTRYVNDAFELDEAPARDAGTRLDGSALLEEKAEVSWGTDGSNKGFFHNVLRIDRFDIREHDEELDVRFSLSRSITSRILWDERAGGILVDEGYIKVRKISDRYFRVTSRKVLNFSDRTPNTSPIRGFDFGETLNYLTPAALIWWVESEMYSTACDVYRDPVKVQDRLAQQRGAM